MSAKPTAPGNWVYSLHDYNFGYGTFADGVVRHDDFGITVTNAALANANAWTVPLYIGEFTNFSLGVDARQLTDATMAQTGKFLSLGQVAPRELDVLGLRQRVHADDRHRPDDQPGHPGREARTGRRPRHAEFERTSGRIVHQLPAPLLSCSFDGTSSTDADGSITRIRVDLRRRGDEHRVRAESHLCDGRDVLGDADGHRQPRCDGQQDVCRDASRKLPLYASDAFSRVVANGWGVANQGGAWTPVGSAREVRGQRWGRRHHDADARFRSFDLPQWRVVDEYGCASDGDDRPGADRRWRVPGGRRSASRRSR